MVWSIYVCPMIGTGTDSDPNRPKHSDLFPTWGAIRYSVDDETLAYFDGDQTDLDTVDADSDCENLADVTNIDTGITNGRRGQLLGFLEPKNIPAKWITTGDTPRQIVRGIAGIFLFAQRFEGLHNSSIKTAGATLTAAWSSLSTTFQNELLAARDDHGWTEPDPTPSTSYEDFLIEAGEMFQNEPIFLGPFSV